MAERTRSCSVESLRLLLANELSPDAETQTAEHVAECPGCQRELESLAGDRQWWTEVRTCLRESDLLNADVDSMANSDHLPETGTAIPSPAPHEEESFAADFAVDFLQPCEQPETLGRIDDIEILEVIGRGGMGVVLKGYQRELGRYVAVKVMAPHLAASGSARKRFAREARAAAAIVHPHVMAIHSVNASSRLPYLVMPCVDCESLQHRLDRDGPLELNEILRIGRQVAAGLAAAHAQGIVHRDVKPANILLERGVDRVMLTDFGLARAVDDATLTRTGVIAGTPQFMSPEQARGETIDARSDLFSLGSVMYAMCTGRPPFRAETSIGVLRRISDVEPRSIREINPDLPEWLEKIVIRLLAKDSHKRFPSAAAVAELLETCLSHVQQPTVVSLPELLGERQPAKRTVGRWPRVAAWSGSITIVCIVAIVAAALSTQGWKGEESKDSQRPAAEAAPQNDDTTLPADSDQPSTLWNDGSDVLMLELDRDSAQLEEQAERLWDDSASLSNADNEEQSTNVNFPDKDTKP